jgi:PAS domain-containing protein
VLPSAKVSKRHCVLVVSDGKVIVNDQGSSNGTFVNGVLTKNKPVRAGDRISVGEYVFELTQPQPRAPRAAPAVAGLGGKVLQLPTARAGGGLPGVPGAMGGVGGLGRPGAPGAGPASSVGASAVPTHAPPKDLKGKLLWAIDHQIMPFFYTLNLKHEWKIICIAAMAAFAVGNLVVSVYPLIEQNRAALVKEMGRRASFMARQIAERNTPALAARAETRTDVGSIETAEGVRVALLTDLESRILAPASKLNQYLTSGGEAALAVRAKRLFLEGRETGVVSEVDDSTICAIEPVRVMSTQAGRNVTVAMAIVSIDTSLATPDLGEMGVTYSETLILTGIIGGLILFILYKITLKPFLVLNEDMDKVLKGDMPEVTHEFKFAEMDPLWDLINSALQRVPKGGAMGGGGFGGGGASADELAGPFKMIGNNSKNPMMLCDSEKKIIYLNPMFEEVSGIRADNALGQEVAAVARDQSLGMFTNDLFERSQPGSEGVAEDYDFSGVSYKCHASCAGSGSGRIYVFTAIRAEG